MNLRGHIRLKLHTLTQEYRALADLGITGRLWWAALKQGGPVHAWVETKPGHHASICLPHLVIHTRDTFIGKPRRIRRCRRICAACRMVLLAGWVMLKREA